VLVKPLLRRTWRVFAAQDISSWLAATGTQATMAETIDGLLRDLGAGRAVRAGAGAKEAAAVARGRPHR
jgi:hypothetical protein